MKSIQIALQLGNPTLPHWKDFLCPLSPGNMCVRSGLPSTNHSVSLANASASDGVLLRPLGWGRDQMSIAHCSYGIKPARCLSVNATLHCLAQIGSEGSTRRENRSFHHSNKTRPGRTLDKLTSPCSPEHSKEVICGGKDVFFFLT